MLSNMSVAKHESSDDVASSAKKCQTIPTKPKVGIIKRLERSEKMADVAHLYQMNC